MVPTRIDRLHVGCFRPDFVELELAAHGDGAVFASHVDTLTGEALVTTPHRITMVAYLFGEPRQFTGGQLRYFAIGGGAFVDIEREHNPLLAVPSIAPHTVRPVSCAGVPFRDWRFTINIWVQG